MFGLSRSFTAWTVVASQTNADAVATHAGIPHQRHYVTGITISGSAAPAAPVSATLTDGGAIIDQYEIPTNPFIPIIASYNVALRCGIGNSVVLTVPALGSTIKCSAVVRGYTITE